MYHLYSLVYAGPVPKYRLCRACACVTLSSRDCDCGGDHEGARLEAQLPKVNSQRSPRSIPV